MKSDNNETNFIRMSPDVRLGNDVQVFAFTNLYGCTVGDRTRIGTFVEIQRNALIGSDCKISSHTFICEGVQIEDRVFIGHNVTFINDLFPRATNINNELQSNSDWQVIPTKVLQGASIGSGATILCGLTIGRNSIVGAGSVLTKSIPDDEVWVGNPARFLRKVPQIS